MPKTPVDYSKTVIYKIQHQDKPELLYVGSTTNFTKRKNSHKRNCNNLNNKKYNLKVYQMIKGGENDQRRIDSNQTETNANDSINAEFY